MSGETYRRVVTGLDAEGRSTVVLDGPVPRTSAAGVVWHSAGVPADNAAAPDTVPTTHSFAAMHGGGTNFLITEMPPGIQPFWHATDTIDYIVVIKGEIVLELEAGETRVGPGEFIVDRGVIHAWRNDGPETVVMASITIPAHPVGKGRTVG